MRYFFLSAVFTICVLLHSIAPQEAAGSGKNSIPETKEDSKTELEEAMRIYSNYYRDKQNLDRSIRMLEKVLDKDPENLEALLLLSRVWLTYGYAKAKDDDEKSRVFKYGFETARRALEVAPHNPDAHFFHVANLGSWGETKGVLRSLFLLPKIRGGIERILELDPDHVYGLAMQGLLYYSLPGFLGGDLHISEVYLKRAIDVDPNLSTLKIHLAKTLIKQEKYEEAKETLRALIEEKNPTFYADWYLNRRMAAKMIARIEKELKKSYFNHNHTSLSSKD